MVSRRSPLVAGSERAGFVVDLRDGIDDLHDEPGEPTERALALLRDLNAPREVIVLSITDAIGSGIHLRELLSDGDERLLTWAAVTEQLGALDQVTTYVGTFTSTVRRAAALARALPAADRGIAALLLVDRAAAAAKYETDFRHGIAAAAQLDRGALSPHRAVDTIVRACLRHRFAPGRPVALGLLITFEILATSQTPAIGAQDVWAIRAALALLPEEERTLLLAQANGLHREDRRVVQSLLLPGHSHRLRRWARLH